MSTKRDDLSKENTSFLVMKLFCRIKTQSSPNIPNINFKKDLLYKTHLAFTLSIIYR